MDWKSKVKERYRQEGWNAFSLADERFKKRLNIFCNSANIRVSDSNPEGKDWLVLLKDGSEIYVEWRSYETQNDESDFWVEYDHKRNSVVAIFDIKSNLVKTIIASEEIIDVATLY